MFLPLGIIAGASAGYIAGCLKEKYQLRVGYTRKIYHFTIFTLAGVIAMLGGFPAVQVYGAAVGMVVMHAVLIGKKSKLYTAVARPGDAPYQKFYIIMPFLMTALGGMLSNIMFGEFAIIGYIATGWGDALGEPVGTKWGRHKYRVPTLTEITSYRSLEGSLAVFTASLIGCYIFLTLGFDYPLSTVITASLLISLTTMLVEAVTFHSLDNLTIQLAATGVCFLVL